MAASGTRADPVASTRSGDERAEAPEERAAPVEAIVARLQRGAGNAVASRALSSARAETLRRKIDPLSIAVDDEQHASAYARFLAKRSWSALKTAYAVSDERTMAELWVFRRRYVVDLLEQLRAGRFPDLIFKSAGSTDLGSDYDITVASPGSDNDVKAIEAFNAAIQGEFGVQPGTLFDTNLYAKDFLPVDQSSEFRAAAARDAPKGALPSIADVEADTQDMGALVKQRRYMNQDEWDAYVSSLLARVSPDRSAAARKAYDEADATYQICVAELLSAAREATGESEAALGLEEAQRGNASALHGLQEDHGDEVLATSNTLYLGRMSMIRSIQAGMAELESRRASMSTFASAFAALGGLIERALGGRPAASLAQQIAAQKAQIKQLLSEAIFFAAEAYHSEGAIKHVVAGIQGTKLSDDEKRLPADRQKGLLAERREAANAKLALPEILQSFNEQLGDFLKDFAHYAGTPGQMYVRSSKYVDRMLDAAAILLGRLGSQAPKTLTIQDRMGGRSLPQIADAVRIFVGVRKDPTVWQDLERKGVETMAAELGVNHPDYYKQTMLDLGVEINALARNAIAPTSSVNESTYFQGRNTAFD